MFLFLFVNENAAILHVISSKLWLNNLSLFLSSRKSDNNTFVLYYLIYCINYYLFINPNRINIDIYGSVCTCSSSTVLHCRRDESIGKHSKSAGSHHVLCDDLIKVLLYFRKEIQNLGCKLDYLWLLMNTLVMLLCMLYFIPGTNAATNDSFHYQLVCQLFSP